MDEKSGLLSSTTSKRSKADQFYRYPLVTTLLSVIDEDPDEEDDDAIILEQHEFQRRQSIAELRNRGWINSWKVGLFLAILSGILFTATNILIQYFNVEALEIFLIRSILQVSRPPSDLN